MSNLDLDIEIPFPDTKPLRNISTRTIVVWSIAIILGFTIICAGAYYIPWVVLIEKFFLETESLGPYGNLLLILGFIIISFPFTFGYIPLSLGAGYLYGVGLGTLTSTVGATLGSALCFWLVRKFLRPFCITKMKSVPYAQSFISEDEESSNIDFTAAVLWRFAPIPFGFSNSLFALSSIPFSRFITSTIIGLFPFQIMWVFLGTTLRSLADVASGNVEGSTFQFVSLGIQLFAAFAIPVYICIRAMKKKPDSEEHSEKPTSDIVNV